MASKISNARRALNLLNEKKTEGVAKLLRASEGFTKAERAELADFFDHSIPYEDLNKFKLVLKQRKVGHMRQKGIAENRAFVNGAMVAVQMRRNLNKGETKNIKKAIGDVLQKWNQEKLGKAPAEKTIERDYRFYKKTESLTPKVGFFYKKLKFPKL